MSTPAFKFRAFTSLLTFFSFLISFISGIILYFTPRGKIAHWTHWTFWGLDKDMWSALHINSSLIFFIIVVCHFVYNRKALFRYFNKQTNHAFEFKTELTIASVISLFIILGTLLNLEPFKTIIKWNNNIKLRWTVGTRVQLPIPHTEDLTVSEFCEQLSIPKSIFKQKMQQSGWSFNHYEETIKIIAQRNGISPAQLYDRINRTGRNRQEQSSGRRGNSNRSSRW